MKRTYLQWLLPSATYALGILSLIIGFQVMEDIGVSDIICVFVVPLIPFLFPFYEWLRKKQIPLMLNGILCVHIILSIFGGGIFNLYDLFFAYDLILHGYFGFMCSLILYYVLLQVNGRQIKAPVLLFLILLSTLGVGGLWEIWEYACDTIGGGDSQRVQEAILLGISPVADTMEDLMITVIGVFVFYGFLYVDRIVGHRFLKSFEKEAEERGKNSIG